MLTLTDSQKQLAIATIDAGAHTNRGYAWADNGRYDRKDLYVIHAAGLACSVWSPTPVRQWELTARGHVVAQELSEQVASTSRDMPIPGPRKPHT